MVTFNKLMRNFTQQIAQGSVSWGSLILLIYGLGVIITMMVIYSYNQPLAL